MSEDLLFRPPTPIRRSAQSRTLADLLHELMAHDGLTQRDLARELHVAPNTVNRLLHNLSVPTEETLVRIAYYAHLPITDVREMARRATGDLDPFVLPREADQLDNNERALIRSMVWALLRARAQRVTR